ncbi:MAG: hypothetical protein HYS23_08340 [Geobacter sp.]|nr:hypothetical protein [Geobacter sp.]
MQKMKRIFSLLFSLLCVSGWSLPCYAGDNDMKDVFQSAVYGGLTGVVVGAAVLAFTDKPGDHLDYLGYGAAAGTLAGTAYGIFVKTRSLAEVENGKVKFAIPTVMPSVREGNASSSMMITAELIRGKF